MNDQEKSAASSQEVAEQSRFGRRRWSQGQEPRGWAAKSGPTGRKHAPDADPGSCDPGAPQPIHPRHQIDAQLRLAPLNMIEALFHPIEAVGHPVVQVADPGIEATEVIGHLRIQCRQRGQDRVVSCRHLHRLERGQALQDRADP